MAAPDSFAACLASSYGLGSYLGPAQVLIGTLAALANNAADLPSKPRMMHVSVAGTIMYTVNGVTDTDTFEVGWHPVRFDRVWATALGATGRLWA